jgi:hypothetical protein
MHSVRFFQTIAILLAMLLGGSLSSHALDQPGDYHIVKDCQDDWLVYSKEYGNYVPYIRALHESEASVSILLDLIQDRHFTFLIKLRRERVLFVNGALERNLEPDRWHEFSCDSLYRKYGTGKLILTVYGQRGTEGITSLMGFPKAEATTDSLPAFSRSLISLKPKSANIYRDFSVIAWLLILVISAIVFANVPEIAYKMASPISFFSRDFRAELYHHHRAYSPLIVLGAVVLALISAFLLITIEIYVTPVLPEMLSVSGGESVSSLTLDYLLLTLLCLALFYVKYLVISVTLGILNMSELSHIHFIKALQSSLLFYAGLSIGLLLLIYQNPVLLEGLENPLLWGVTLYYGIRYVVLYIVLNQPGRIINLYLISYLCVVELIPLIIGIKFIM